VSNTNITANKTKKVKTVDNEMMNVIVRLIFWALIFVLVNYLVVYKSNIVSRYNILYDRELFTVTTNFYQSV
jgi:hypothetical protein